jgi:hypothetical protein
MHPTAPQGPAPAAQPPNPAQTAGIILGVCALALLVALFTKGWAGASEGRLDIGAGLLGIEGCSEGRCESVDWDKGADRLDIPGDVKTMRMIGLLAGLAAAGVLGAAAGMCLTRSPQKIPVGMFVTVLAAASGTLTWFAVRLWMSDDDVNFGPAWGAFVGIGSLIAGSVVLRTMVKPMQTRVASAMGHAGAGAPMQAYQQPGQPYQQPAQPYQQPMQQAQPVMCPHGHGPAEFVAQYQRYFCRTCNQYL